MNILVLHGVNLNMLGKREPDIYGQQTLEDLYEHISAYADTLDIDVTYAQTNHEGEFVTLIHNAKEYDAVIVNPGAWTHYSYAIYDAMKSVPNTYVEVHISDVNSREEFRKVSVISDACARSIVGLGFDGYLRAIDFIVEEHQHA